MKIIAMTMVRNAEEYIRKNIENSREQGMYPVMIDNGSMDNTQQIIKDMDVPLFEHKTDEFALYDITGYMIKRVKEMGCDWFMMKDADEIVETYEGCTVTEMVEMADEGGKNCLECDLYEFWPTVDDDVTIDDYTKRILHYSYYKAPLMRMVKNVPEVNITGPHIVEGKREIYNTHLVLRHYKFLNLQQGRKKVKERQERFAIKEVQMGTHTQYNYFTDDSKYYVLEKDVYNKLHVFNGTWIKEQVFDGWRKKR